MNYNEAKEYLKRYLKARIPVITINTVEKNRINRLIKEVSDELNISVSSYSMSDGIYDLKTNQIISDEKTIMGALDFISNEVKTKQNANYILNDVADINDSNVVSRYLVDVISKCEINSGVIIIITNDIIWGNIQRLGISLKLSFPSEDELRDTIIKTIEPYKGRINVEWDENDYTLASTYLQGLSEMEVKNVITSLIVNLSASSDLLQL